MQRLAEQSDFNPFQYVTEQRESVSTCSNVNFHHQANQSSDSGTSHSCIHTGLTVMSILAVCNYSCTSLDSRARQWKIRTQQHKPRTAVTPGHNHIFKRPGAAVCLAFSMIFQRVVAFQINSPSPLRGESRLQLFLQLINIIIMMMIITKSCQEFALVSSSLDLTFDRQW